MNDASSKRSHPWMHRHKACIRCVLEIEAAVDRVKGLPGRYAKRREADHMFGVLWRRAGWSGKPASGEMSVRQGGLQSVPSSLPDRLPPDLPGRYRNGDGGGLGGWAGLGYASPPVLPVRSRRARCPGFEGPGLDAARRGASGTRGGVRDEHGI
jgi:hypothetical protein